MSFPDEGYSINASYALILRLYYYHWIINDTFDNRLLVIKGIIRTVTSELWYWHGLLDIIFLIYKSYVMSFIKTKDNSLIHM